MKSPSLKTQTIAMLAILSLGACATTAVDLKHPTIAKLDSDVRFTEKVLTKPEIFGSARRSTVLVDHNTKGQKYVLDINLLSNETVTAWGINERHNNSRLPEDNFLDEIVKRLFSVTNKRTCFLMDVSPIDYRTYGTGEKSTYITNNPNGTQNVTTLYTPPVTFASTGDRLNPEKLTWSGVLLEEGEQPVPLKFGYNYACAEKEISWKKPFSVVVGVGEKSADAFGTVGWYFNDDNKKTPETSVPLKIRSEKLGLLNINDSKLQTIINALATKNMKWLQKEIPLGLDLYPNEREELAIYYYNLAKHLGEKCDAEAINYLVSAGAIVDAAFFEASDKEGEFRSIYDCLAYSELAYNWAPKLRTKIFTNIHNNIVRSFNLMTSFDSPQDISKRKNLSKLYKAIHKDLSAACLDGETDKCVLLDTATETLGQINTKLASLRSQQRENATSTLWRQILENDKKRRSNNRNFI